MPNIARDGDVAAYQDMCALHLCSTESMDDLNTRLEKKIKIYNFRPNIIVTNINEPYAEDYWREIEIGEVKLTWIAPCTRLVLFILIIFFSNHFVFIKRCLLPTVDQETGIKDPKQESWKTLRRCELHSNNNYNELLFI